MKINAISSLNYNTKVPTFKNTAVPYPEFDYLYPQKSQTSIFDKISALFNPKVTKEANDIKSQINSIYDVKQQPANPKSRLLSVLA